MGVESTGSALIGSLWITTSLGNDMINAVKSRVMSPSTQGV